MPEPVSPTTVASTTTGDSRTTEVGAAGASAATVRAPAHQRYDVLGEHGRGGLGVVLRARDIELGRQVAIKQLLRRGDDAETRFLREALITARLEHPGIVPVHEAGRWSDGTPFYAMKLVSGRPLAELIAAAATPAERLGLVPHVIAVADAIAYAHDRRVIHRDLKPSNVLVGDFGETVVIDWGLAKDLGAVDDAPATGAAGSADLGLTALGSVMGTPAYMAPEQACGEAVDERADVYAVGALLFELITGRPPGPAAADRRAIERALERAPIAADLRTIVGKAIALEPADRYPSAGPLAEDLRRYDRGARVHAHRYSWPALAVRFARRHRLLVALSATFLALLALGAVLSVLRIRSERDHARAAEAVAVAERNRVIRIHAESALATDPTSAITWLSRLSPGELETSESRQVAMRARALGVAEAVLELGAPVPYVSFTPDGSHLVTCGSGTLSLWRTDGARVRAARGECFSTLPVAPDGSVVYASGNPGGLLAWDLASGELRTAHASRHIVEPILVAADGSLVAGLADGGVLRAAPGAAPALAPWPRGPHPRALSGSGRWLASFDAVGDAWLTETTTGRTSHLGGHARVRSFRFAAGDCILVILRADGSVSSVALGDRALREVAWDAPPTEFLSVGSSVAALVHRNESVSLWDVASRTRHAEIARIGVPSMSRVSADDAWVAVGSKNGPLLLHERATGHGALLKGHEGGITDIRFQPGGGLVATASSDGTVRIWRRPAAALQVLGRVAEPVRQLVAAPGGAGVAAASDDGTLRVYAAAGAPVTAARHTQAIASAAYAPSGDRLAWRSADGRAAIADPRTGQTIERLDDDGAIKDLAFAPDGAVVLVRADGRLVVRRPDRPDRVVGRHDGARWVRSLDASTLISAGADGAVVAWDLTTGRRTALYEHPGGVLLAAVAPGPRLTTVGVDSTLVVWSPALGATRVASGARARALAIAPGGTRVAVADSSGEVRLWATSAVAGSPPATLRYASPLAGLCFIDETTLVGASGDGALLVWSDGELVDLWTTDTSGNTAVACGQLGAGAPPGVVTATRDGDIVSWQLAQHARSDSVRALTDALGSGSHPRVAKDRSP